MVLRKPSSRSNPRVTRIVIQLGGLSKRSPRIPSLPRRVLTFAPCLLPCIVVAQTPVFAQRATPSFSVEETTIAQIHAAMREHRLTCRQLVDAYLQRIDAYDKRGPAIN